MSTFLRGTPVIINTTDAPIARMVACIMGWDAKEGVWKARYLSPTTHMTYCWGERPTAVADFGMTVELDVENQEFRGVPHGACTATYEDGVPRNWQDYGGAIGRWHKARGPAFLLAMGWMKREMEKVAA